MNHNTSYNRVGWQRIILMSIVIVGLTAVIPQAQQAKKEITAKYWWDVEEVRTKLALTDEQLLNLKDANATAAPALKELRKIEGRSFQAMLVLLNRNEFSEEEFSKARAKVAEAAANRAAEQINWRRTLREILTREQWRDLQSVAPYAIRMNGFSNRVGRSQVQVGTADSGGK